MSPKHRPAEYAAAGVGGVGIGVANLLTEFGMRESLAWSIVTLATAATPFITTFAVGRLRWFRPPTKGKVDV
jgi:hypothetical protein